MLPPSQLNPLEKAAENSCCRELYPGALAVTL